VQELSSLGPIDVLAKVSSPYFISEMRLEPGLTMEDVLKSAVWNF
jgi:hypothetical protein